MGEPGIEFHNFKAHRLVRTPGHRPVGSAFAMWPTIWLNVRTRGASRNVYLSAGIFSGLAVHNIESSQALLGNDVAVAQHSAANRSSLLYRNAHGGRPHHADRVSRSRRGNRRSNVIRGKRNSEAGGPSPVDADKAQRVLTGWENMLRYDLYRHWVAESRLVVKHFDTRQDRKSTRLNSSHSS